MQKFEKAWIKTPEINGKTKQRMKLWLILLLCCISTFCTVTAYAASTYSSSTCPHNGKPVTVGYAGCSACGGSGYNYENEKVWKNHNGYFSGNTIHEGSGTNMLETGGTYENRVDGKTYDVSIKTYYRCYNCGDTGYDCKKYDEVVSIEYYDKNTGELIEKVNGTAGEAKGYVPIRWCNVCGPKGAGTTVATWAQKHFPKDADITVSYVDEKGNEIAATGEYTCAYDKTWKITAPSELSYNGKTYQYSKGSVSPTATVNGADVSITVSKSAYTVTFTYKETSKAETKITVDGSASISLNGNNSISGSYRVKVTGGIFDSCRVGWASVAPGDSSGTVGYQSAGSNSDTASGSVSKSDVKSLYTYYLVVEVTVDGKEQYFYSNQITVGVAATPTPKPTTAPTPTPKLPVKLEVLEPPNVVLPEKPITNTIPKPPAPTSVPTYDTGHLYECYTGYKHTHSGSNTSGTGCYTTYSYTDYYSCTYCGGNGMSDTDCSSCDGTGKRDNVDNCTEPKCSGGTYTISCSTCNGTGKVKCSRCSGIGETGSNCGGTYEKVSKHKFSTSSETCGTCKGTGKTRTKNCIACSGTGRIGKCSDCSGSGGDSCGSCSGTGYSVKIMNYKCTTCSNTGSYDAVRGSLPSSCSNCNTLGTLVHTSTGNSVKCNLCNGSGNTTCSSCNGDGKTACPTCSGNGKTLEDCSNCNGSKKITKYTCKECDTEVWSSSSATAHTNSNVTYVCSNDSSHTSTQSGTCKVSTKKTCETCSGTGKVACTQTVTYNDSTKTCSSGSYSFNCGTCGGDGKIEGICPYCDGYRKELCWRASSYGNCPDMSTAYYKLSCGKTAGNYYVNNTECSSLCKHIITAYEPVYPEITTTLLDIKDNGWTLDAYARAHITVLASSHTSYVSAFEADCSYTALDTSKYNTVQTITLTFGGSGWYLKDAHAGTPKTVSMTMKVTIDSNVTVSFDAGLGRVNTPTKVYKYGSSYGSLPSPTAPTGYQFVGWYTKANGAGIKVEAGANVVDYHNHVLYAYYTEKPDGGYTITWDARPEDSAHGMLTNGQRYFYQNIYYGKKIGELRAVKADIGYEFKYWRLIKNNITYQVTSGLFGWKENLTFQAYYEAKNLTVTFNANGGTCKESTRIVQYNTSYGMNASLPEPVRTGYAFTGWYTSKEAATSYDDSRRVYNNTIVTNTENHTLYAGWRNGKTTVTFQTDISGSATLTLNGTSGIDTFTKGYTYPQAIGVTYDTFPIVACNTGYQFTGLWYVLENGTKKYITTEYELQSYSDHTVYATMSLIGMNVSFNRNGGIWSTNPGVWNVTYSKDYGWYKSNGMESTRTFPAVTKKGYTFLRWTQTDDYKTAITENTTVTKLINHTIYAYWGNNKYTITFYTNGADTCSVPTSELSRIVAYDKPYGYAYTEKSVPVDEALKKGSSYTETELPKVQKYGYHFDGWYLPDGTRVTEESLVKITADTVVTARWTADIHTVFIEPNDTAADPATIQTSTVTVSCDTSQGTDIQNIGLKRPGYNLLGLFRYKTDSVAVYDKNLLAVESPKNGETYKTPAFWVYKEYVNGGSALLWEYHKNVTLYAHWKAVEYYIDYSNREWNEEFANNDNQVIYEEYKVSYDDTKHTPPKVDAFADTLKKYRMVEYSLNDRLVDVGKTQEAYYSYYESDEVHKYVEFEWTGWDVYKKINGILINQNLHIEAGAAARKLTTTEDEHVYLFPTFGEIGWLTLPRAEMTGYKFLGWTENQDSSMTYLSDYQPQKDLPEITTLYAAWEALTYQVALDDRGATSTGHTKSVRMTFDETGSSIIVPTKTGYTFQGYYTEIRGNGTKYYDEAGKCIKAWTIPKETTLYAYWTQNPVVLPTEDKIATPTPAEFDEVKGEVYGNKGKALLYADDYNPETGALTDLQPYLTYDTPGMRGGIPETEQLSFRARVAAWLLSYTFQNCSETEMVRIYVTVPYRTQYEQEDETLVISERKIKTYSFEVPKVWSYWEIAESTMYYPERVIVENAALKERSVAVAVNPSEESIADPSYEMTVYGEKEEHVFWPEYDSDKMPVLRIDLEEEQYIISDKPGELPEVTGHLVTVCRNAAWKDEQQAKVRSDLYRVAGIELLSDTLEKSGMGKEPVEENYVELKESVTTTDYPQTYLTGIELDEYQPNGVYNTTVIVAYREVSGQKTAVITKALTDVNAVNIHTPVACHGVIAEGMLKTDEGALLDLEEPFHFFTLRIENTGMHRKSLGYGTRDFTRALSGKSNIAMENDRYLNQVSFSFDVYVDVGANSRKEDGSYDLTGDYLLEAGTWLTIGKQDITVYVSSLQASGSYFANFRTIAVNCPKNADNTYALLKMEEGANISPSCYVAADSIKITVNSTKQNFILTDTDDLLAKKLLLSGFQALTLKKGYSFSFDYLTLAEPDKDTVQLSITPELYWISSEEQTRKKAVLYQKEKRLETETYCSLKFQQPEVTELDETMFFCWKGSGYLPANVCCVTEEDGVIRKDGYLVINFKICWKSGTGEWYTFEQWENTKLAADAAVSGWNYVSGDVIRYDLSKSIFEDYEVGGLE